MSKSVIGIIFNQDRTKVLCVKRRDVPVWVFPGGGVDPGETSSEAVIREAFEETGLKTIVNRKIGEYTPINKLAHYTEVFECTPASGQIGIGPETADIKYWSIDELPNNFFIIHREWLYDALLNSNDVLQKPISGVTYWNLFKHLVCHPTWVVRIVLSRCGYPINSK